MKKYLVIIFVILVFGFLFGTDYIDYKTTGVNYFFSNDDYTYSQTTYSDKFNITLQSEKSSYVLDDEYNFEMIDYDQSEDIIILDFVIRNNDYNYMNGKILYLYSFESSDRDYSVSLIYNDSIYEGEVIANGPFNDEEGFRFTLKFDDVSDAALNSETFSLEFNDMIITRYERKWWFMPLKD